MLMMIWCVSGCNRSCKCNTWDNEIDFYFRSLPCTRFSVVRRETRFVGNLFAHRRNHWHTLHLYRNNHCAMCNLFCCCCCCKIRDLVGWRIENAHVRHRYECSHWLHKLQYAFINGFVCARHECEVAARACVNCTHFFFQFFILYFSISFVLFALFDVRLWSFARARTSKRCFSLLCAFFDAFDHFFLFSILVFFFLCCCQFQIKSQND